MKVDPANDGVTEDDMFEFIFDVIIDVGGDKLGPENRVNDSIVPCKDPPKKRTGSGMSLVSLNCDRGIINTSYIK